MEKQFIIKNIYSDKKKFQKIDVMGVRKLYLVLQYKMKTEVWHMYYMYTYIATDSDNRINFTVSPFVKM